MRGSGERAVAVIVVASASGSPGVTTTCLALASVWPRPVLLVDADPTGGSAILAGFFQGRLPAGGGLTEVALGLRRGDVAGAIAASAIALPGTSAHVLPGVAGHAVSRTLSELWPVLLGELRALAATGQDVLVDAGRLGLAGSPEPLIYGADAAVLAVGSSLPAVAAARSWAATWAATFEDVGTGALVPTVLVVGPGRPYGVREVGSVLPVPVLGSLAWDPAGAAVFSAGASPGRRFRGGALMRSVAGLQEAIAARVAGQAEVLGADDELAQQVARGGAR